MTKNSILSTVIKHVKRVLPKNWKNSVKDGRRAGSTTWDFEYILDLLMASALSGKATLRDVETFSEIYDERIPDTTLHDMMRKVDAEGMRQLMAHMVKETNRSHELPIAEFPIRLVAIDGKALYSTREKVNDCSARIHQSEDTKFKHMVLRAMLVSSDMKQYLGQREIDAKKSESTNLIPFVDELLALYGRTNLIDTISIDAGIIGSSNAEELVKRELNYIMAVKTNLSSFHQFIVDSFEHRCKPDKVVREKYQGKDVIYKLTRMTAEAFYGWESAEEFWCIDRVVKDSSKTTVERRYFATSLMPDILTNTQVLTAVRMHWNIENNGNWIFDVCWKEDSAPWCSAALVLVSYLRMIAYNIIARVKHRRLRAEIHRATRWRDFFTYFEHALVLVRQMKLLQGVGNPAFV